MPVRKLFAAMLIVALILFMPLRLALGAAGDSISIRSAEGTLWGGRMVGVSLAGVPLGDLDARLSVLSLLLGKARIRVDGAQLHGAITGGITGRGGDIESLALPLSRALGPVRLTMLELSDAHLRFRSGTCAEADGLATVQLESALGGQRLSGPLKCNKGALGVDLVSQPAMQRLSLRFPDSSHYEALITVRAADTDQATRLTAIGFRETSSGHILRFSGPL